MRRKPDAEPAPPLPTHPPNAEAAALAGATAASGPARAAAPPIATASTDGGSLSAAGTGLVLLLAAATLALAFAAVPRRALAAFSVRLVERRADIGLAMALTVLLAAAALVVLVGT